MELLLLLLAWGLTGAFPLEDTKLCPLHSQPWQVSLHSQGTTCSGVLINKWWLVTSFACAPRSTSVIASLGEQDVTVDEGTEQHIPVADVIYHDPYRSPLHSLVMVRLVEPARLNQYVQPIGLPGRCPQPGDSCSVSGWGSTVPQQYESPKLLKCLTVTVVEDQTCMSTFPDYIFWSIGMVCAGGANETNCLHDNGAVLVCDGQLQGVQWFSHGCENEEHPSVYTKLCMYNDWMRRVMDNYIPTTTKAWSTTSL
ncbi:trypsinogen-like protein 3 [Corythoichthys intestinalis]|uniref:trypsinogen-like protein 3 n=1 Tax=Corythoichthys intestinalis TaxID=161448 RepID=UPI0025A5DFE0|nr:trypsinogen-like protein 3 [Corythoichthys intestinalis]XP_061789527.1 trypsinogen-like protein 3 [Nerophis lumbriciformis]